MRFLQYEIYSSAVSEWMLFPLLLVVSSISGCASYRPSRIESAETPAARIGPVDETLIRYYAPQIVLFPTKNSPSLVVRSEEYVDILVEHRVTEYEQVVLDRNATKLQVEAENMARGVKSKDRGVAVMSLIGAPIVIAVEIIEQLIFGGHIRQSKTVPIAGSEREQRKYSHEFASKPSAGHRFKLDGVGTAISDERGHVTFNVSPALFVDGKVLTDLESGQSFEIRCTKHHETVTNTAPWGDPSKILTQAVGHTIALWKIKNIIAAGGGLYVIAAKLIIDEVTLKALGVLIDIAASETTTAEYYRWAVLARDKR